MSDLQARYARLALRPDATEKDVRRAYARELRKIDQATQPAEFQELREAYDHLLWDVRRREREAQDAAAKSAHGPVEASGTASGIDAHTPAAAGVKSGNQEQSPQPTAPTPAQPGQEAHTRLVESEKLATEFLEEISRRLQVGAFERRDEVEIFLSRCLEDQRLASVDARQYFEWGVAHILASGWRPRHDLLFPSAIKVFGWADDRSRLLWLGRAGEIVDTAIAELAAFDSQAPEHRAIQKEVIRALRVETRPGTSELVTRLPVAEYVVTAFPHWLHIISEPSRVEKWREWMAAVPTWRRRLASTRIKEVRPQAAATAGRAHFAGYVLLFFLVIGGLGRLLSSEPATVQQPARPSTASLPIWNLEDKSAALNTSERWKPYAPPVSPEMQAFKDRMFIDSLSSARGLDPDAARKRAAALGGQSANGQSCASASQIVAGYSAHHQAGEFGSRFDRLLLRCRALFGIGSVPESAVVQSADREQHRAQQELEREQKAGRPTKASHSPS